MTHISQPGEGTPRQDHRPLRDTLLLLPRLPLRGERDIDYEAADPALLSQLLENAQATMDTVHRGTTALGQLLVLASPEIGTGEFPADVMEALGYLLAEVGDLAVVMHSLSTSCQRFTADYVPATTAHVANTQL